MVSQGSSAHVQPLVMYRDSALMASWLMQVRYMWAGVWALPRALWPCGAGWTCLQPPHIHVSASTLTYMCLVNLSMVIKVDSSLA